MYFAVKLIAFRIITLRLYDNFFQDFEIFCTSWRADAEIANSFETTFMMATESDKVFHFFLEIYEGRTEFFII